MKPIAAALTAALVLIAGTAAPPPLGAEVLHADAHGFRIRLEAAVPVPAAQAYGSLCRDIGRWWHPDHTYTGDAANLSLTDTVGGALLEKLPGGSVEHLRVIYVDRGSALRLAGGLGPLQELGLAGAMTWSFAADGDLTRVTLVYNVSGSCEQGLDFWAGPVDGVLAQQLERLRRFLETGRPE